MSALTRPSSSGTNGSRPWRARSAALIAARLAAPLLVASVAASTLLAGSALAGPPRAASAAGAAQIDVTTTRDLATPACPSSASCSLRGALAAARSGGAVSVPAGTYNLTQGELELCPGVSIDGAGARTTIVAPASGQATRVFEVLPIGPPCGGQQNASAIAGLTITGGDPGADANAQGGGLLIDPDATLEVTDATITGNRAGGPQADGAELGGATGGGVDVEDDGALTLLRSTVSQNVAGDPAASSTTGGAGGGIYAAGAVTVSDSTIAENRSDYEGGGIYIGPGATVDLRNATVDANQAGSGWSGGNVYLDGSGDSAGGNTSTAPGLLGGLLGASSEPTASSDDGNATLTTENSIIADGTAATLPDCATSDPVTTEIRSLGSNLSSGTSCELMAPGDVENISPKLGPLRDNGGPTDTLAPAADSPAIGAALASACPAVDQRGVPLPAGGGCDVGAVQGVAAPAASNVATPRITALRLTPATFAPARSGPSILTGAHPGGSRAPGTLVSFADGVQGSVTFTVLRKVRGVLVAGVCRTAAAAGALSAGQRSCERDVVVGSFGHAVHAGAGEIRFSGRVAGRPLSGSYVLRATPRSSAGTAGTPVSVPFSVT